MAYVETGERDATERPLLELLAAKKIVSAKGWRRRRRRRTRGEAEELFRSSLSKRRVILARRVIKDARCE